MPDTCSSDSASSLAVEKFINLLIEPVELRAEVTSNYPLEQSGAVYCSAIRAKLAVLH